MTKAMEIEEAVKAVKTRPLVPIWPTAGLLLDMSRSRAYIAAQNGEIDVIRNGRSLRAISSSLRKRLKID